MQDLQHNVYVLALFDAILTLLDEPMLQACFALMAFDDGLAERSCWWEGHRKQSKACPGFYEKPPLDTTPKKEGGYYLQGLRPEVHPQLLDAS